MCCLCASPETRRYFWETMVSYTLLVNELLEAVPNRPEFPQWQRRGTIDREAVRIVLKPLKAKPNYAQLPKRFLTSAELIVCYVYKSWLALQKRRQWQLEGKRRWLAAIEADLKSILSSDLSFETVQAKARKILEQAEQDLESPPSEVTKKGKKSKRHKKPKSLLKYLLDRYDETTQELEHRAICHLLRHDMKVGEEEDTPDTIQHVIDRKRIEIARLTEQLQSRLPKGRDPNHERFVEKLEIAVALPDCSPEHWDPEEFDEWRIQKQISELNTLPYPILFGSASDLYWDILNDTTSAATGSAKKRSRKSKRPNERLQVRFKGLDEHKCKIQCDRRQLKTFRQFATDYISNQQLPKDEKFGEGLFALRSACLIWKVDPEASAGCRNRQKAMLRKDSHLRESLEKGELCLINYPWETHRLYLHCTFDIRLLTQQGTEQVRLQKLDAAKKLVKKTQERQAADPSITMTENQASRFKAKQTSISRLEKNRPAERPECQIYQPNPNIFVGISLSRHEPVTVIVFNKESNQASEYWSTDSLLKIRGITSPRNNQSIVQLHHEQQQLLRRWRRQRHYNLCQRPAEQKQGDYHQHDAESRLGDYLDRLIAARVTELAVRRQAAAISLPELRNIRESVESDIQARAGKKYPHHAKLQAQYAKQYRREFHRWSFGRLEQYITEAAKQRGIVVCKGRQPKHGNEQEKALAVITSAIT
ncbi:type V CRISPR-associated protein Cas12k [Halomicronema sp. CCY15110]|uniref:type V CRISPR-associated protein Cas12k n=1 Tax=Halomicronema sp. CCY15110 TaxID=2767773 RepID=UPI001EF2AA9D|nr:type V CRISPR-associated protein Cas12k [Halomicronema sp. CCY15110]